VTVTGVRPTTQVAPIVTAFDISVTRQGVTNTFTVTVNLTTTWTQPSEDSSDASLSSLRVVSTDAQNNEVVHEMLPPFVPGGDNSNFAVNVPNNVTAIEVDAVKSCEFASVVIAPTQDGAAGLVPLAVGDNVVTITVTAQNGDVRMYTVTVTRAEAAMISFDPVSAIIHDGNLTQVITVGGTAVGNISISAPDTLPSGVAVTYDAVAGTVTVIGVRPTTQMAPIVTAFDISVTRQGVTNTFTVTVNLTTTWTQPSEDSSDASLSSLRVVSADAQNNEVVHEMLPPFVPGGDNSNFAVNVPNNVTAIEVDAVKSCEFASVVIAPTQDGAAGLVPLAVGDNVVTITVTAQNGDVRIYTVTVTRAEAAMISFDPVSAIIHDGNLTQVITVGGTAVGNISISAPDTLPSGVAVTYDAVAGTVTVTGVRPTTQVAPIVTAFDISVTRQGVTNTFTVTVNLTTTWTQPSVSPPSGGGGGGGAVTPTPTPPATGIDDDEVPLAALESFAAFIQGYPDDTFRGTNRISREEFVTILFRMQNPDRLPEASPGRQSFTDVAPDRWSFDAIEWAVTAGILEGGAAATFQPRNELTRAEMAVMLVRAEGWTEVAEDIFSDIEDHANAEDILKAVYAGIFEGFPDGTFRPDATATRYEMVTALVRYAVGGPVTDDMITGIEFTITDVPRTHWAYRYVVLATAGFDAPVPE